MEGLIIYKGRYGATRQYAIWLAATLKLLPVNPDFVKPEQIATADFILIGTSVYIGQLQIKKWLQENAQLLAGKKLIFFIVAGSVPNGIEKLNSYYEQCVPVQLRASASRFYLPGRLNFSGLSWKDKLLLRAGAWLAAKKGEKIVLEDYDHVSKEHLLPVIDAVHALDAATLNA